MRVRGQGNRKAFKSDRMMRSGSKLLRVGIVLVALAALGILAFRLFLRPTIPPGRLVIRTVPTGVRVVLDDSLRGTTSDTGLVLTFPTAGHFRLALSRAGYEVDTSTVRIGLDEVLEIDVVMKVPGMAFIRGGTFEMGSEEGGYNERPVHRVFLDPFYMDLTEVRAADFRRFHPGYRSAFAGGDLPATNVSREEARDYCRSVGKRLPTEAEWERACRGARGTRYSYGDTYDPKRARTGLELGDKPAPAGSFLPGNGGLYDMTGNVWEWCSDWYGRDAYRRGAERNPRGPATGTQRVLRGGAWYSNARYAGCTHRPGNILKARDPSFGFRCAKDIE